MPPALGGGADRTTIAAIGQATGAASATVYSAKSSAVRTPPCAAAAARDRGGDRAAIKRVRPLLGDQRQGRREIGLHQPVAGLVAACRPARRKSRAASGSAASRSARAAMIAASARPSTNPSRASAIAGAMTAARPSRPYRGCSARSSPITVPGTAGGAVAVEARLAHDRAGGVEDTCRGVRRARRRLAEIDDACRLSVGAADQHEPAAADIAAARIDDGQRIADRDRGIDRIAAGCENAAARPRSPRAGR